jgi:hypothetical protein
VAFIVFRNTNVRRERPEGIRTAASLPVKGFLAGKEGRLHFWGWYPFRHVIETKHFRIN